MQMPERDPHPSTLPGFKGTRDHERSVTRSRSGKKKKRVEFEDVQPQDIPNPTEDNFPRRCITQLRDGKKKKRVEFEDVQPQDIPNPTEDNFPRSCITQLPDGVSHIYYAGMELTYWFYEYCEVGQPMSRKRYHIDHRNAETIIWEPWLDSAVSETEDVLNAKLLSYKRILLQVPNGNCEYYLGDRCWRQVTSEVHIHLDPPLSMSLHISPATLHEIRQAGFVDCEQFVVREV
ncbi:hypothetical protein GIB67_005600 [Kingdonia uniflora]|uniref:Uncharacterized protein n=1 Tax=Kingdonia uniflora TaxID=39325 RepID=A0A7J7NIB5_9MAGN|nr:hypothetical protein GIB67_005600 [Kingdonia uniflora]